MIATERLYPICRPLAAFSAGAAAAILGGLIGLGGAEFRLPILIAVFALFAHRAVRINLLISLATLAMSAVARLGFLGSTNAYDFRIEIVGLLSAGRRLPRHLGADRCTAFGAVAILAVSGLVESGSRGVTAGIPENA